MKPVVEIENLSKKYLITQGNQQIIYSTLVETLARQTKSFLLKMCGQGLKASPIEEFYALKNLSLNIEEGDRLGIIGRNGAGKSTLLKVLSRIIEPTEGSVKIHGRVASLLEVGTGFHPELTGKENIFLNGAILGMSHREIKRKFDEIVTFAEVEKFLDTPVKRYSSGMYTRLGFAVAAHLDPDILIIDEVLAVGDAQFQSKCLKKLNELGKKGRTVLFVSHDVGAMLNLCNKGVYLEKGKLVTQGPIEDCVNAYMKHAEQSALKWNGCEGDEHLQISNVALSLEDPLQEFFYQGTTTQLNINYEVLKPCAGLYISFSIWNQRNQLIARSDTTESAENECYFTTGKHKLTFDLDISLFHEGDYRIQVECAIHNRKQIIQDEIALKLPVYSQQKNSSFIFTGHRSGVCLGNRWQFNRNYGPRKAAE